MKLLFNDLPQYLDGNGDPYAGAQLFTYAAGSSTKQTVYQDSSGTQHSNPIDLDANGRVPAPIWGTEGVTYKLVLAPADDTDPPTSPIWTIDNVSPINDSSIALDQWTSSGMTATYVSGTQFTVPGDQTTPLHPGRRVKIADAGGTKYGVISASAYTTLTTVTVAVDSGGSLSSPISDLNIAVQTAVNHSEPILTDDTPLVSGSSDKTKKARLELDGLTTATTRVLTVQDKNGTISYLDDLVSVIGAANSLTASRASASTIDIDATELVLKNSSGSAVLAESVNLTLDITASGANGLDTGAEASGTWYYGWVIYNPTTDTVAGLLSTSSSAPTMPSGYTFKALVTAARNDGSSNFLAYRQFGSKVYYEAQQSALSNGTATTETAVALSSFVPPIAVETTLNTQHDATTDGSGNFNDTVTIRVISGSNFWSQQNVHTAESPNSAIFCGTSQLSVPNISQQVYYLHTTSAGSGFHFSIWVCAFKLPGCGS